MRPASGEDGCLSLLTETFVVGATRVGGGEMKKPE